MVLFHRFHWYSSKLKPYENVNFKYFCIEWQISKTTNPNSLLKLFIGAWNCRASLSMRITESILAVILVASRYEIQFLSCCSFSEIWFLQIEMKVSPGGGGGTQIWVGQGCAARVSKPIPIFKGDFDQKGNHF